MVMQRSRRSSGTSAGLVTFLVVLAGSGCGESGPAVVARVAERPIDEEALRRFVMTLPPGLRTSKQGQEARRDYLQTLIDRELMLLEAEARRLDEDPQLQRRLRRKVEDRILALYRRREFPPAEVTSDEVEARMREMGLDRERLAEAILVPSEEEALRIRAALSGGQRFEDLGAPGSGSQGGVVGYLNRLTAPRAGIPAAVFDTLATGEVSPPLPLEGRWRLVRFVDDRTSTEPSLRDRVRQRLMREARQEMEDQKVEVLARELNWAPDAGGMALLAGLDTGNRRIPELTHSEARAPLFTFEGGVRTVEDYLDAIREHKVRTPRALTDSGFAAALGQRLLQGRALLLIDAERLDLGEEPEIVQWRDQVQREQLLQALRSQIVDGADSMATGERVRTYYDEHRESFRLPEEVCFDEILFPSREEAEEVLGQIDDDVQLLDLSRLRGNKIRRRRADGLLCANSMSRQVLPGLWSALEDAPVGVVTGPVSLLQGRAWVLIKVVRREPERFQSFDEARPRARASLLAGLQRQLFEDWLATERGRRQGEIEVFDDRLGAALPEALLANLVPEDEA